MTKASIDKKQLRRQMRKQRLALTRREHRQAANQLVTQVLSMSIVRMAKRVGIYLTNDGELDTAPLVNALLAHHRRCYVPIIDKLGRNFFHFQQYTRSTFLAKNRFGIDEPIFDKRKQMNPAGLSIIFMPLVAFDQSGQRLGMGGGFYDRTLSKMHCRIKAPSMLVGLAFDFQEVPALPAEPWDIPLDAICTPSRCLVFSN